MKKLNFIHNDVSFHRREYIIRYLFLIMAIFAVNVNSFAFEVDGIKYNIENSETKEVSVAGLSSSNNSSEISIPTSVEYSDVTYSVTSIGIYAFKDCSSLVSISLPNSLSLICDWAFENCTGLTSITIPNSVTSIGSWAFNNCSGLSSIILSNNLTNIYQGVFSGCSGLSSITIPNGVTTIEQYAFFKCKNLASVDFPNSVTKIGASSFEFCEGLTSLVLPGSLTSIEPSAFYSCNNLNYVKSEITQPFEIASSVFNFDTSSATLCVPKGTKSSYLQFPGWSTFRYIIEEGVNYYDVNINITEGYGNITYGNKSTSSSGILKYIEEGSTLLISPSPNYQIYSIKVNGEDVTPQVSNNSYSLTINSNTAIEVAFEKSGTYRLWIFAGGNGSAQYNNEIVRATNKNFKIKEGEKATIFFFPDDGWYIARLKVDDADVTKDISNNCYTLYNIRSDKKVDISFQEVLDTIVVPGANKQRLFFQVVSQKEHTLLFMGGEEIGKILSIPETVTHNDGSSVNQPWTIIGIREEALDNCEYLSAIIWNPAYKFEARVSNPNLLLYVKSVDYAPSTVNNVIVNGKAQSIILTDAHSGNDFYCPKTFTAEKISYTHRYGMKTGMGESRGWETIALPFDVQHITLADKEIKSFATWKSGDAAKPFWLYQLGSKGYVEAESIKAYTPYLISLPNNEKYIADYRLAGSVKFSAENVEIKNSDNVNVSSYNGRRFVPNFATQEANAGLYVLNVNNEYETYQGGETEGSQFVLNLRQVHPFEAYMTTTAGTRSIEIFDQMTTAIKDNWLVDTNPGILRVYDLSGKMVGQGSSIEEIKRVLPAGVYIVNHQKIIIK